jgi:hypothetical protein
LEKTPANAGVFVCAEVARHGVAICRTTFPEQHSQGGIRRAVLVKTGFVEAAIATAIASRNRGVRRLVFAVTGPECATQGVCWRA